MIKRRNYLSKPCFPPKDWKHHLSIPRSHHMTFPKALKGLAMLSNRFFGDTIPVDAPPALPKHLPCSHRKHHLGSLLMQFTHLSVNWVDSLRFYLLKVMVSVYGKWLEGFGVCMAFGEYFLSGWLEIGKWRNCDERRSNKKSHHLCGIRVERNAPTAPTK